MNRMDGIRRLLGRSKGTYRTVRSQTESILQILFILSLFERGTRDRDVDFQPLTRVNTSDVPQGCIIFSIMKRYRSLPAFLMTLLAMSSFAPAASPAPWEGATFKGRIAHSADGNA